MKLCPWTVRPGRSTILTPLHPGAMHRHTTYVIATGHTDARGRPYEVHYCHCGQVYKFMPVTSAPPVQ